MPTTPESYGMSLSPQFSLEDIVGLQDDAYNNLNRPLPRYTPELSSGVLDLINRRGRERTAQRQASAQSDILARGGTGSSSERFALERIGQEGDRDIGDRELEFLLSAADRGAQDRQFRTQVGLGLAGTRLGVRENALGRQFSRGQLLGQQEFSAEEAQLSRDFAAEQAEIQRAYEERLMREFLARYQDALDQMRKQARRSGIGGAIGGVVGGIAGLPGGPIGSAVGAGIGSNAGSSLGFLFS